MKTIWVMCIIMHFTQGNKATEEQVHSSTKFLLSFLESFYLAFQVFSYYSICWKYILRRHRQILSLEIQSETVRDAVKELQKAECR